MYVATVPEFKGTNLEGISCLGKTRIQAAKALLWGMDVGLEYNQKDGIESPPPKPLLHEEEFPELYARHPEWASN